MKKSVWAVACMAVVLALCASPASALVINVARQGTATQSSLSSGGVPTRGNDGGLGRAYSYDSTTTHTNSNPSNWWEVDLGGTFDISQIDLHNRGDCCSPPRLGDFRVSVLDAPGGNVVYPSRPRGFAPRPQPNKRLKKAKRSPSAKVKKA